MLIAKRSDYPVTTAFPNSLETLVVNGCALKKIESRIMRLSWLVTLDMSDNSISNLPDDWTALNCLAHLNLARNCIASLPSTIFSGKRLTTTLAHLDLSENQLTVLPSSLTDLSGLAVLKVGSNKLVSLPEGISRLRRLVQLSAAGNGLQVLPGDFDRLTLQSLDLFGNPLAAADDDDNCQQSAIDVENDEFPALFELAARRIKNSR